MTGTRSRRPPRVTAGAACTLALALFLAGCSPGAPPGVSREVLDAQVSRAIGDPNSCLLIAEAGSGRVLYRYNTATACDRELPSCVGPDPQKTRALLEAVSRDRQPRAHSCNTIADASRGVGWSAGPVAGTPYVYAAMMEGDRAFPGLMMADRLKGAFRRAKLSKEP